MGDVYGSNKSDLVISNQNCKLVFKAVKVKVIYINYITMNTAYFYVMMKKCNNTKHRCKMYRSNVVQI